MRKYLYIKTKRCLSEGDVEPVSTMVEKQRTCIEANMSGESGERRMKGRGGGGKSFGQHVLDVGRHFDYVSEKASQ